MRVGALDRNGLALLRMCRPRADRDHAKVLHLFNHAPHVVCNVWRGWSVPWDAQTTFALLRPRSERPIPRPESVAIRPAPDPELHHTLLL